MAGLADFQANIISPTGAYGSSSINYVEPEYFQAIDPAFSNPVFGVDQSGLRIKTGFEKPSLLDAIKEGLYKGLTGASNPNPYASPYGTKPEEKRMAGTRTAEMSDFLKSAIAGLLETKLNTRNPSIYEGYLR